MIRFVSFKELNEEESLKEIKRLKRTINKILKDSIDYYGHKILDDGSISYPMVSPSPETILYWDRKFLKDGINHLENDLHVPYIRTKQEQKEKDILDKLKHIKKFKFNYNSWPHPESSTIVIEFVDNELKVELEYPKYILDSFDYNPENNDFYKKELLEMYKNHDDFKSSRYEKTKEGFLEALYDFCFEKWKKKNVDYGILDGAWFDIEIEYDNNLKKDRYEGLNNWPYGFDDLKDYMYSLAYRRLGGNYDED